jgi:hypothetical protein
MVKYKWYTPQLAALGVSHWRVLTWREREETVTSKYFLATKTHTIQHTACSVTLYSDHVRIWRCPKIHHHSKQNTASLDTCFITQCCQMTFSQKCNVKLYTFQWFWYILCTHLLVRDPTKNWDVQIMVVWVVTPSSLASLTNLYLTLQPWRQRQQVLLEYINLQAYTVPQHHNLNNPHHEEWEYKVEILYHLQTIFSMYFVKYHLHWIIKTHVC